MTKSDVLTTFRAALQGIGYEEARVRRHYDFADLSGNSVEVRRVPLAAFSDYPHSYQNACVGIIFATDCAQGKDLLDRYRSLGAPLLMEVTGDRVQAWAIRSDCVRALGKPFLIAEAEKVLTKNCSQWGLEALGVSRRTSHKQPSVQPDFFDRGLMPMLQKQFQQRLHQQLELSYDAIRQRYVKVHGREPDVAALFAFLFRFVTAKIFMDRADATGWDNLGDDPLTILKTAERHTGLLDRPESNFRRKAILETAWETVSASLQFHNLAAPDLAFVAESAFITPQTRKQLGVHSTPAGLAEYIVGQLDWDQVPWDQRVVFEPFSGHGILLAKAMERMGQDLPSSHTPAKRHEYFRRRLIGVEDQPLSLEICRLVLTLSDYPNGNSWDGLHCGDVFRWKGWDETLRSASVILANPPYEAFEPGYRQKLKPTKTKPPAEMIHKIMQHPPALLGLVLPRSFLTDPVYREANRQIATRYRDIQIVELPPIFRYARNDTLALIAGGLRNAGTSVRIRYSEVPKGSEERFFEDFHTQDSRFAEIALPPNSTKGMRLSLRLLPSRNLPSALQKHVKLGGISSIHKGINWIPRTDGKPQSAPRTDVAYNIGQREKKGFHLGAEKMEGNLAQYQLRELRMLSLRDDHQDPSTRANKRPWHLKKVAINAARFQPGSPWRIAAWTDANGMAFTKQYFCIWTQSEISEFAIAAVLNSPVTNQFVFDRDRGRDNRIETLSDLPLPACEHLAPGGLLHQLAENLQALLTVKPVFFDQARVLSEAEVRRAVLNLDAAVLDAYELTGSQQQRLLHLFDGWTRPLPPPFDQCFTRYFPVDFAEEVTLRQYLSDQEAAADPEWSDLLNEERCMLIEKEYLEHLTVVEEARLESLQQQQAVWAARHGTRDFIRLDSVLAELRVLPEDDELEMVVEEEQQQLVENLLYH